MITKSDW